MSSPSDRLKGKPAPPRWHELKTWPEPFAALAGGEKTCELRRADRPFAVGHALRLREWDPTTENYSGREAYAVITHILAPSAILGAGLVPGYVLLSLAVFDVIELAENRDFSTDKPTDRQ